MHSSYLPGSVDAAAADAVEIAGAGLVDRHVRAQHVAAAAQVEPERAGRPAAEDDALDLDPLTKARVALDVDLVALHRVARGDLHHAEPTAREPERGLRVDGHLHGRAERALPVGLEGRQQSR